jgi:hypothetical protein
MEYATWGKRSDHLSDNPDHESTITRIQKRQLTGDVLGTAALGLSPTPIMARKFFVGGNFKMNPTSKSGLTSLVNGLNQADLDPNTGLCHLISNKISLHSPFQRSSLRPLQYI